MKECGFQRDLRKGEVSDGEVELVACLDANCPENYISATQNRELGQA